MDGLGRDVSKFRKLVSKDTKDVFCQVLVIVLKLFHSGPTSTVPRGTSRTHVGEGGSRSYGCVDDTTVPDPSETCGVWSTHWTSAEKGKRPGVKGVGTSGEESRGVSGVLFSGPLPRDRLRTLHPPDTHSFESKTSLDLGLSPIRGRDHSATKGHKCDWKRKKL